MKAIVSTLALAVAGAAQTEADHYRLEPYTPPDGEVIEAGGLAFVNDTDLLVSTRRGRVWWIQNALADDPADARWHVFAEGLHEGLGLAVVDGTIWVLQRGELSTLHDLDGDKRCDEICTVTMDWGMSGNYHEFAFGLPRDPAGQPLYRAPTCGFFTPDWWLGKSHAKWRGWILQYTIRRVQRHARSLARRAQSVWPRHRNLGR